MDAVLNRGGRTKLPDKCEYKGCDKKALARCSQPGPLHGVPMCGMHRNRMIRGMDMDAPDGHKKRPRGKCKCQSCDNVVYHLGMEICKTHYWRYKTGRLDWSYPLSSRRARWKNRVRLTPSVSSPWAPHVDIALVNKLRRVAERDGIRFDDLVNDAIRRYFADSEQAPEARRRNLYGDLDAWSRNADPMEGA